MLNKVSNILLSILPENAPEITEETLLRYDLGLNSFDLVNLVKKMEEEFQVAFKGSKVLRLQSVGDVIEYIESQQKSA